MKRKTNLLIAIALLVASLDASAQILPRLGDNVVRPTPPPVGEDAPDFLRGSIPAIVDLNLVNPDNLADRRFAVAWLERRTDSGSGVALISLYVAVIDGFGDYEVVPTRIARHDPRDGLPSNPAIVAHGNEFFSVLWSVYEREAVGSSDFEQRVIARTFYTFGREGTTDLCPADALAAFDPWPFDPSTVIVDTSTVPALSGVEGGYAAHASINLVPSSIDADASASGRTILVFPDVRSAPNWGVWSALTELVVTESQGPDPTCTLPIAVLASNVPPFLITGDAEARVKPRVAINANNDISVATWRARNGSIQAQRIGPTGVLQGDRITVAQRPESVQQSVHDPDVAYGSDGFFRVVWERNRYFDLDDGSAASADILMSRFDAQGNAAEQGLTINTQNDPDSETLLPKRTPRVEAGDRDGDIAIAWRRGRAVCPQPGGGDWILEVSNPDFNDCTAVADGATEADRLGGSCIFRLRPAAPGLEGQCRAGFRLSPHPATPDLSWVRLAPDQTVDFSAFEPASAVDLEFDLSLSLDNRCVYVEATGSDAPLRVQLEQTCASFDSSDCVTCAEQLQQRGLADSLLPLRQSSGPASPTPTGRGLAAGEDIVLRWLHRDFQDDAATRVEETIVSGPDSVTTRPGLGLGRDGEMLVGWIDRSEDPVSLVTQSLAGPVELQINDVGILEGPLTRATANFTLTANKSYPVLPGGCGTAPVPSVTLLTADGSASFEEPADYVRTTTTLDFGADCGQTGAFSRAFPVEVLEDSIFEGTESFFVDLFDEANAIVVRRQGIGAIVDNDPPEPVEFVEPVEIEICENGETPADLPPRCPEGGDPTGLVTVELRLPNPQAVEGSVEFQTFDGVPTGGIGAALRDLDYEPVIGEVVFLPGVQSGFLSLELVNDGLAELDEQFFLELVDVENLTLPDDRQVAITIIDNDRCDVPAEWFVADGTDPSDMPSLGTEAERTGYFCITNPSGFSDCPWESRLVLEAGEAPWITLTDLQFPGTPPAPGGGTEIDDAQRACGDTGAFGAGAIKFVVSENSPSGTPPVVEGRTQTVGFANGAPTLETRDVSQPAGDCSAVVDPASLFFFSAGGETDVQIGFGGDAICEFTQWKASIENAAATPWLTLDGANANGEVIANGPGELRVIVDPHRVPDDLGNPLDPRVGAILVNGQGIPVTQEAPLYEHFDDATPPDSSSWTYTEIDAWSEAGTRLTADTPGRAEVIATGAFPGCSMCEVDARLRFDTFALGRASVYLWWSDEDNFLELSVDEFRDEWTLTQRIDSVDQVIRTLDRDVLVGVDYDITVETLESLGGPLIRIDVDGTAMCPLPGPGLAPCQPAQPDPNGEPVVGAGVVGLAVEDAVVSVDLLRAVRSDALQIPLGTLFLDGFESP